MSRLVPVLAGAIVLLAACSAPAQPAAAPIITTNVYAVQWLASELAGDLFQVNLTEDVHEGELAPDDVSLVKQSQLVLFAGNLDVVDPVFREIDKNRRLDLSSQTDIGLLSAPPELGDEAVPARQAQTPTTIDPHIWLGIEQMQRMAVSVAGRIKVAIDPSKLPPGVSLGDAAQQVQDRLKRVQQQLADLTSYLGSRLTRCRSKYVVVEHPAYQYLLRPFGLMQVALKGIGNTPLTLPEQGAKNMSIKAAFEPLQSDATLRPYIFADPEASQAPSAATVRDRQYMITVQEFWGANIDYIETLEGKPEDRGHIPIDYVTGMQQAGDAIGTALGCTRSSSSAPTPSAATTAAVSAPSAQTTTPPNE